MSENSLLERVIATAEERSTKHYSATVPSESHESRRL